MDNHKTAAHVIVYKNELIRNGKTYPILAKNCRAVESRFSAAYSKTFLRSLLPQSNTFPIEFHSKFPIPNLGYVVRDSLLRLRSTRANHKPRRLSAFQSI